LELEFILERRMVNREGKAVIEVLVKWKHLPIEEASWEGYWVLLRKFSGFDLETRSSLRGSNDAGSIRQLLQEILHLLQ